MDKVVNFLSERDQWIDIDEFKYILQSVHSTGIWMVDVFGAICFFMFIFNFS